ncbi:MAG: sulfotransferase family protein [Flavobacteriaceae bacterium]|nr:sulfotransferase family protein [Flavobacteriaceae bacterium]
MIKNLFNIFNKKELLTDCVFIHIPKTGGSTFIGALKDATKLSSSEMKVATHKINNVGNVQVKHVDFSTKERFFKGTEIFKNHYNPDKNKKHFMLVRNPIDRVISEFNFQYYILNGKEGNPNAAIISRMKPRPTSIDEYIEFKETQNYQIKFLLGKPLGYKGKIILNDLDLINNKIEELPIYCGVTDEYSSFLKTFEIESGIKLSKKIVVRKKTPFMFQSIVSEKTKKRIRELNSLDYKLYELAKSKSLSNNLKEDYKYQENDVFIV